MWWVINKVDIAEAVGFDHAARPTPTWPVWHRSADLRVSARSGRSAS